MYSRIKVKSPGCTFPTDISLAPALIIQIIYGFEEVFRNVGPPVYLTPVTSTDLFIFF